MPNSLPIKHELVIYSKDCDGIWIVYPNMRTGDVGVCRRLVVSACLFGLQYQRSVTNFSLSIGPRKLTSRKEKHPFVLPARILMRSGSLRLTKALFFFSSSSTH